jgi:integrase
MPRKRLTEEGVAKLKPPAEGKQVDYFDAGMPGLVLRVNYGGAKIWRALYYRKKTGEGGKRTTVATTRKIGVYPHLKLKEARDRARVFLADPHAALAQADSGSFREVAENFIRRHVEANKLRTQSEIERNLKKHVYPEWEHKPFREIKRGDVASLLDKIEDESGSRQADIVLAIVRKMMNWYTSRNDDYVSPVVRGMHRNNGNDRRRKRILNDDEIRALWNGCGKAGIFGSLVQMLLLTAQRRDKVATMKRTDVNDGVWTIPSEAREKSNAGKLKLPPLALGIVEAQPRIESNPFVFPGSMQGRRRRKSADGKVPTEPATPPSFNSFSQRKAELDEKLKQELPEMPPWTIHDLRRTAKSLMARAGVRPDISERVLGHAIAGVEGVYDRHSYDDEKADALQALANLVDSIINPPEGNNVVALATASRRPKKSKASATA